MSERKGVFITGDRLMTPYYPGWVAMEMLRAVNEGARLMTGINNGGVEHLVREIAKRTDVHVQIIEQTPNDPNAPGYAVDWDARYLALDENTEVLVIHVDHQDCRETKSALNVLPDERVRLMSLADFIS